MRGGPKLIENMPEACRLLIFRTGGPDSLTETFIRDYAALLPFEIHRMTTPPLTLDGTPLCGRGSSGVGKGKLLSAVTGNAQSLKTQRSLGEVLLYESQLLEALGETALAIDFRALATELCGRSDESATWPLLCWVRRSIRLGRVVYRLRRRLNGRWNDYTPMRSAIKSLKPDVILAHYGMSGAAIQPIATELDIPLVVHFHGWDAFSNVVLRNYTDQYKRMFAGCAAVVARSVPMADQLAGLGCPQEKIVINAHGVDLASFFPNREERCGKAFLSVGRFTAKKGPYYTLAAFRRVLEDYPEARLRMIGDGPFLEVCKQLASKWRVEGGVEFLGAVGHEVVKQEMRAASVFLQHSVTARSGDQEGTPVAILEAAASGLPIVATRHAGIPEAVTNGVTGYLVPERDVAGMARCMEELLLHPERACSMGRMGREMARRRFSQEARIGRLAEVLREVVRSE